MDNKNLIIKSLKESSMSYDLLKDVTNLSDDELKVALDELLDEEKINDKINHSTGILSKVKVGDRVKVGDVLAVIYSDLNDTSSVIEEVKASYKIGSNKNSLKLIYEVIR